MNDFFNSVKADLLDRRMVPIVAAVLVALLAALGYALFGAGSSTPVALVKPVPGTPAIVGVAVTPAQTNSAEALAETTNGGSAQQGGQAHDPFAPLAGTVQVSTSSTTTTSTSTSTSSGGNSSSSGSSSTGGTESNSGSSKGSTPAKKKTVYKVAVLFGELPAGVTPQNAQLVSYPSLTKATPLPSAKQKLIEFVGVTLTHNGKGALFTLNGEIILHGPGICLPSATQCQVVKLQEGKSEQLEYLPLSGPAVVYELRVVSIGPVSATASAAQRITTAQSKTARTLTGPKGALHRSGLRYASLSGVFVFARRAAFSARAHTAVNHGR